MNLNLETIKGLPKAAIGKAKPFVSRVTRVVSPKAPEILLAGGVLAISGGCVLACVKTAKKLPEVKYDIEMAKAEIESDYDEDEKEYKQLLTKAYLHNAGKFAQVYAVPVGIIGVGIGCVIMSHNIQRNRVMAISAAYNTLLATFNEYRGRVIEAEGVDKDRAYLYGEREETVIEQKTGKNGKVTEKEKTVKALGSGNGEDLYTRVFDMHTSKAWTKDVDYNLMYILAQQRIFNNKLDAYGYVFLDEVYEALGFDLEGYSNAKMVGWVKGLGDDYIDFGIYNPDADMVERAANMKALKEGNDAKMDDIFLNGYNNAIWLNFNCDGIIVDKI